MFGLSVIAQPAGGKEKYEYGKGKSLLSRMYPGLSCEQAEAVIRQELMVEQLRRATRARAKLSPGHRIQ